jgi:hypothetical protein
MSTQAYVNSFEAVRDFRAALVVFLHEAREAITSHDLEVRRTLEWILNVEPQRWQQQARVCDEQVVEAKIELERCRYSKLPGGESPSCIEERKALERARHRRDYAEQKIESIRKWGHALEHDAAEYAGRANQLGSMLDVDLVAAIALVDRVLSSLEAYAGLKAPEATRTPPSKARSPGTAPPLKPAATDDGSRAESEPDTEETN